MGIGSPENIWQRNLGTILEKAYERLIGSVRPTVSRPQMKITKKRAGASDVAHGKFLVATFILRADRRQCGGMMTQLHNDYAKGHKTYPDTAQKAQALLKEGEGKKSPIHGSNEGIIFSNVVNNKNGNRGAASNGDTQASGG